ncbi:hypothetical protein [Staphylothermus hellenicus]|uniref:Antitoxin SocA-like Panacea domain-containing protein n=1 Tax=Staphylothermus hellenicus (strain DSM 12710 / JCM 10830 / BK20S6-10-b1 / P8) TaxID=591019 RepID=D7DAP2_STAHD|nr:hypothetical protein [Staphylothermus hellenicus]ADI31239.1 hypothetical protein Shell_0091 [Staphylothermus hellenicus DSM 12710]
MIELEKIIGYILSETGCMHPYRLSRVLALAELEYYEKYGERLTNAEYKGFDKVFYIEGVKELFENNKCFNKREGDPEKGIKGCIEYTCQKPVISEKYREPIDKAIAQAKNLTDEELNELVFRNPLFNKFLKPM